MILKRRLPACDVYKTKTARHAMNSWHMLCFGEFIDDSRSGNTVNKSKVWQQYWKHRIVWKKGQTRSLCTDDNVQHTHRSICWSILPQRNIVNVVWCLLLYKEIPRCCKCIGFTDLADRPFLLSSHLSHSFRPVTWYSNTRIFFILVLGYFLYSFFL